MVFDDNLSDKNAVMDMVQREIVHKESFSEMPRSISSISV